MYRTYHSLIIFIYYNNHNVYDHIIKGKSGLCHFAEIVIFGTYKADRYREREREKVMIHVKMGEIKIE